MSNPAVTTSTPVTYSEIIQNFAPPFGQTTPYTIMGNAPGILFSPSEAGGEISEIIELAGSIWIAINAVYNVNTAGLTPNTWYQQDTTKASYALVESGPGGGSFTSYTAAAQLTGMPTAITFVAQALPLGALGITPVGGTLPINGNLTVTGTITGNGSFVAGNKYPFSMRNKIINGSMEIDQRNNGASVNNGSALVVYGVDRWATYGSVASKFSVQQVSVPPGSGPTSSFATQITSLSAYAPGASEQYVVQQRIEAQNMCELDLGTASAGTFTVSFWAKASIAATYVLNVQNSAATRSYPFLQALTTTWAKYSVTIPGDVTGTWVTSGTGIGLTLNFDVGLGSSLTTGTANTWGTIIGCPGGTNLVATNGATLTFTDVQLETGSVATPFEQRLFGTELTLCQRYCYITNPGAAAAAGSANSLFGSGYCFSATAAELYIQHPVPMRAAPSLTALGAAGNYILNNGASFTALNALPTLFGGGTTFASPISITVAAGLTLGQGCILGSAGTGSGGASAGLILSAEL